MERKYKYPLTSILGNPSRQWAAIVSGDFLVLRMPSVVFKARFC